jgi:hypothetical protein
MSHKDAVVGERVGDPRPRYPEKLTDGNANQVRLSCNTTVYTALYHRCYPSLNGAPPYQELSPSNALSTLHVSQIPKFRCTDPVELNKAVNRIRQVRRGCFQG